MAKETSATWLTGLEREMYYIWEYVRKVCLQTGHQRYEGVPLEPGWENIEQFVKNNRIRYYRAIIKWKNYQRVAPTKHLKGKLKNSKIRFVRKVKELGYTKENTVFTSPSDMTKYAKHTHKYIFENKLLGTRDIQNILRKKGMIITQAGILKRLQHNINLFEPSERYPAKWRNIYRSLREIADMENISYDILKKRYNKFKNIRKAVNATKQSISKFNTYNHITTTTTGNKRIKATL